MGAGGSSPVCIRKAASNKGGNDLPRHSARRRIPRHAVWDSEYRDGAVACKICHKEHSTASLGHSEVLSVPNDPSHGGSYSQYAPSIFPAPGLRSNNMKVWFFNLEERFEDFLKIRPRLFLTRSASRPLERAPTTFSHTPNLGRIWTPVLPDFLSASRIS